MYIYIYACIYTYKYTYELHIITHMHIHIHVQIRIHMGYKPNICNIWMCPKTWQIQMGCLSLTSGWNGVPYFETHMVKYVGCAFGGNSA